MTRVYNVMEHSDTLGHTTACSTFFFPFLSLGGVFSNSNIRTSVLGVSFFSPFSFLQCDFWCPSFCSLVSHMYRTSRYICRHSIQKVSMLWPLAYCPPTKNVIEGSRKTKK
ncbi:unnamed protein product [Citrullus colocynthis]|uniref:Uncharacterized protein n=1 Tax=Citrullus colocynthis TaxID=252529 RepID=A0ABP0YDD7_9ROSI